MKSPAKVNIFLKITGTRSNYHEIASRFILFEELYDEIEFIYDPSIQDFTIEGMDIDIQSNIIYKAYLTLLAYTKNARVEEFFRNHKIKVTKNIPFGAGLGGGSSNAATFLKMTNSELTLSLDTKELAKIGAKVGADVPFFIYGYKSANVTGIGEIIEPFEEEVPPLELKLLQIHCDTAKVYKNFRENYITIIDPKSAQTLLKKESKEIIKHFSPLFLNDLYKSAIKLCPKLNLYKEDYFLSGSGSTLFKEKDEKSYRNQ